MSAADLSPNRTAAEVSPAARRRGYRWLLGVWVVVALFGAVALVRSRQVGIPIRDPGGAIFTLRVALSLGWFALLVVMDGWLRAGRGHRSIRAVAATVRRRWPLRRLLLAFSGLLAYHLVYLSYHNLKSWNALNGTRDDQLLRLDSGLFLGHSPAVLLHDLLGQHVAAWLLAVVYESFSYLVPMSFVAALVFARHIRDGYVFLTAALWTWILGTLSYYLLPSLGPFASAPTEFARLPHTWITSAQTRYMADRAHFLQDPAAHDAFNSVNAFASLHVGFTCMALLMIRYYGFRRATRVLAGYLVVVIVATIYLGWHFALDDLAGLLLGYLSVLFGRLMIYPRGRAARPAEAPDQGLRPGHPRRTSPTPRSTTNGPITAHNV